MSFKMRFGLWLLAWLAVGIPTAYSVLGSIAGVLMAPVFPGGFAYLDKRFVTAGRVIP